MLKDAINRLDAYIKRKTRWEDTGVSSNDESFAKKLQKFCKAIWRQI